MSNLSSGNLLTEALELGALDHYVKSSMGPTDLLNMIDEHLADMDTAHPAAKYPS